MSPFLLFTPQTENCPAVEVAVDAKEDEVPDLPPGGGAGAWSDTDDDDAMDDDAGDVHQRKQEQKETENATAKRKEKAQTKQKNAAGRTSRKRKSIQAEDQGEKGDETEKRGGRVRVVEADNDAGRGAMGDKSLQHSPVAPRRSRILKQIKTAKAGGGGPSRCKLADLLLKCEDAGLEFGWGDGEVDAGMVGVMRFSAVMAYLKKLPPPLVDVDMSLLCRGEWDDEGLHLVELAMEFLLEELR